MNAIIKQICKRTGLDFKRMVFANNSENLDMGDPSLANFSSSQSHHDSIDSIEIHQIAQSLKVSFVI
jgi:hypothetical protein